MANLRILGPLEVWDGDERVAVGGPRQRALLAFLVLHANRAVSRDRVIDAIWGPARSDADNRLQMAIARLRKALPALGGESSPRLQTVSGGYLLSIAPGELDADSFHALVHAGMNKLDAGSPEQAVDLLSDALRLWRGPPLADVAFDDFAQPEIRRLEELRIRALECRIDAELRLGRHAELVGELEALLAEAPTREHLAAQLMVALYRSDRQADALEVYQRIRVALAEELGLEPGPALKALQIEILEQGGALGTTSVRARLTAVPAPAPDQRAPMPMRLRPSGPSLFAGRRHEREALIRALREVTDRTPRAAFVTGEAGIGKTRLVSEFAQKAHEQGALVLAGRCDDGLSLPYQPFVEALEHAIEHAPGGLLERHIAIYGPSIARLVPELSRHAAEETLIGGEASESERYVLFRAIEGLLAALCETGPVMVVLEDLHWADQPTLTLLRRLLTAPRSWALMLLCTGRVKGLSEEHPLRELLADAHREPHMLRLDLLGLSNADVLEMLQGMGDKGPVIADLKLAETLEANTNGNPFFISELVRSLAESGALATEGGLMQLRDDVELTAYLPASISETLAQRLRRLNEDVRRYLDAAAVVGEEFEVDLVSEVAGVRSATDTLATAIDHGLVAEIPGRPNRLRFAHSLMQRYLYRELGQVRQSQLHRRVALALERRGHPDDTAAELATHWIQAVDPELETALEYSILAGDEALTMLAPDEARRWYENALHLLARGSPARDADRCDLLIKRGEAEHQAGDRRFRETLLEAAELAQRIGDDGALVKAALANTRGMQSETGVVDEPRIATLDRALDIVGTRDSPERARLLAMQAAELMYSREWERRVRLSDEALQIARRLQDPDALSTVLNMRFVTLLSPESLAERRDNTVEAIGVAERLADPLIRFYAYHWRAYVCIEDGDILAARAWAAREREIAERFRQPTTVWLTRADEANLAIIAGDLDLADDRARAAFEVGRLSEPDALACYAAQQTSIAFERGTLGEFVQLLEQAVRDNPGVPGFRASLALALTEVSRHEQARELLEQALASRFRDLPYDVTWLAVVCIYARVASQLAHQSAAELLYRMLEPWSGQIAFPAFGVWWPVDLHLCSLASVTGNTALAERHLLEASRTAIRAGAPRWEAIARGKLGDLAELAR